MVSLFRLKGRALQIDNTVIMMLTFFTGAVVIFTVSLLPAVYDVLSAGASELKKEQVMLWVDLCASLIFILAAFGFYSSVRLGTKRYLLKKATKKKTSSRDIFFYFFPKRFISAFFYSVKILTVKLLILLFCFLPSAVCLIIVESLSCQGVSALVCVSLGITALFLLFNGGVFYSLFFASFFLCDYYFIVGSCVSFRHLVSCSQKNMIGKKHLLAQLRLSFSGWLLLCLFILPIPYVWGYYNQSLAVAAAEFMD